MSNLKMHADEIDIDVQLVRQLLNTQFPQWSTLPIKLVSSAGTDNALYRLGNDMCMRLPRLPNLGNDIDKEMLWLPRLAPFLPLPIPEPLGKGNPDENYPFHWSIYRWLEGKDAASEPIADLSQAATQLAEFLIALHKIDTAKGPSSRRGVPLATQNAETRSAIESLHGIVDIRSVTAIWEECLQAPIWNKAPVWTHGDLLPTNLLVQQGQLSAVIDFSMMGIGDPACDLIAAWSVFDSASRNIFQTTLEVDDATWIRGRGWALSVALIIIPYYLDTNPGLVAIAKRMINEILADS